MNCSLYGIFCVIPFRIVEDACLDLTGDLPTTLMPYTASPSRTDTKNLCYRKWVFQEFMGIIETALIRITAYVIHGKSLKKY